MAFNRAGPIANTATSLIIAYVLAAALGVNRLVWLGTHQGMFYWAYWLPCVLLSLLAFVFFWRRVTERVGSAAAIGIAVGYVASCISSVAMYFQRGPSGPFNAIAHEANAFGVAQAVHTVFVTVVFMGGIVYGLVAGLTLFSIVRRRSKVAIVLALTVCLASLALIAAAPEGSRFHHILMWP